jgi:AcrR family transcriptional regulator
VRARILLIAEEHFRRIGHHKTSVADIATELGMSRRTFTASPLAGTR